MIFLFRSTQSFAKTLAKERYKVTDNYWLDHPDWRILFILVWMMFIRFGKVPFHTGRKLEACQRKKSLFLTICVENVMSKNFSEMFCGSMFSLSVFPRLFCLLVQHNCGNCTMVLVAVGLGS